MAINNNKTKKDEVALMRNKKKRRKGIVTVLVLAALSAAAIVITVFALNTKGFSTYKPLVDGNIKQDEPGAVYASFKEGYVQASRSGVEYVDESGNTKWNEPVDVSNPLIQVCGDKIFVADISGNNVEVFDSSGHTGKVETPYSIYEMEGTAMGRVAIMTQDKNINYLELYEQDGDVVYSVKTTLGGEGYPLSFDISDDGSRLALSYVKAENKPVETGIRFYDFSGGKLSEKDRVTGEFSNYDGELTGEICFFENGNVAAVSENNVKIYTGNGKGISLKSEHGLFEEYEGVIKRVIKGSDKLILILSVNDVESPERMMVFDENGGEVCDCKLTGGYDKYVLDGDKIIMTAPFRFAVYSSSGKEITKQDVDKPVSALISNGGDSRFFMISEGNVERIKLS